jgi:hypothetical protein
MFLYAISGKKEKGLDYSESNQVLGIRLSERWLSSVHIAAQYFTVFFIGSIDRRSYEDVARPAGSLHALPCSGSGSGSKTPFLQAVAFHTEAPPTK